MTNQCPHPGCKLPVQFTVGPGGAQVPDRACYLHILDELERAAPKEARDTILAEAAKIVDGPRRATYGHPLENHSRTAALWSAYLGVPITPRQVCMLNALQKIGRDAHLPWRDNLVDLAGWARNAELCSDETGEGGGAWEGVP